MGQNEQQTRFSTGVSEERRGSLLEFLGSMDEHISAIQSAARDRLTRRTEADQPAPREIRINVTVGPRPGPGDDGNLAEDQDLTPWCGTVTVVCGESETGYIYCTVSYCEITEPSTTSP